jgi:hypothetical protein
MNLNRLALISVLLLGAQAHAQAALIQRDWVQGSGDGLLTYDTASGLEWLDVTVSRNLSSDDVFREVNTGGRFYGFTFADSSEVGRLFSDAGYQIPPSPSANQFSLPENIAAAKLLQSLLGTTYVSYNGDVPTSYDLIGWTSNLPPPPSHGFTASVAVVSFRNGGTQGCKPTQGCAYVQYGFGYPYSKADSHGAFLYREFSEVPLPGTASLLGLGLAVLAYQARRKATGKSCPS